MMAMLTDTFYCAASMALHPYVYNKTLNNLLQTVDIKFPLFLLYQCTSEANAEDMGTGIFNGNQ